MELLPGYVIESGSLLGFKLSLAECLDIHFLNIEFNTLFIRSFLSKVLVILLVATNAHHNQLIYVYCDFFTSIRACMVVLASLNPLCLF